MKLVHGTEPASPWVRRFAPQVTSGEVLDLACGYGRHAKLFAAMGRKVLAVDRDEAALATLAQQGIPTRHADLESGDSWLFGPERFACIVVTNYLYRPLFPHIVDSLAPGGLLLIETFAQGNGQFGKPSNPDFLLAPGELLSLSPQLRIIAFEDGYIDLPRPALVQRICAVKLPLPQDCISLKLN
ncbi:MAG: class I SAM-dependent methyltransferase [Burkholderiaceae bacterium]|nr:class I SAM-dependent methyltransferase [Burkholderiaceae bacterium]